MAVKIVLAVVGVLVGAFVGAVLTPLIYDLVLGQTTPAEEPGATAQLVSLAGAALGGWTGVRIAGSAKEETPIAER
jgi:FlaG/FlaF family flagellin (archaellin)